VDTARACGSMTRLADARVVGGVWAFSIVSGRRTPWPVERA